MMVLDLFRFLVLQSYTLHYVCRMNANCPATCLYTRSSRFIDLYKNFPRTAWVSVERNLKPVKSVFSPKPGARCERQDLILKSEVNRGCPEVNTSYPTICYLKLHDK